MHLLYNIMVRLETVFPQNIWGEGGMEEKDDLFRQVKIMILKDFLKKKKGWVRYGIVSLLCWRNKKEKPIKHCQL